MIKYYKYNQGRNSKYFVKIDEEIPNPFKKFKKKFFSIKECSISLLGQHKVHVRTGIIDQHELDVITQLYKAEEISEEEYNDALVEIDKIKQQIDFIFKYL